MRKTDDSSIDGGRHGNRIAYRARTAKTMSPTRLLPTIVEIEAIELDIAVAMPFPSQSDGGAVGQRWIKLHLYVVVDVCTNRLLGFRVVAGSAAMRCSADHASAPVCGRPTRFVPASTRHTDGQRWVPRLVPMGHWCLRWHR
jgi:hypothetical protein